jgi:dephospho-CoA kinase
MIIGITGTNGSGKTIVCKYFIDRGFEYFSLSDILRNKMKEQNVAITRESLRQLGNELREKYGPGILAELLLPHIKDKDNVVVDSIRNIYEIEKFRKNLHNFVLIGVDAPVEVRYLRVRERSREGETFQMTLEEFIESENKEKSGNIFHQQIDKCLSFADVLIINDGTVEELYSKLEKICKERLHIF